MGTGLRNAVVKSNMAHKYWLRPFLVFVHVGLNIEVDRILEIACVITDGNLTKSIEVRSDLLF